jgi:hypothetical protein
MNINLRITAALGAAVIIAACSTAPSKPPTASADAANPNCPTATGSAIPSTAGNCSTAGHSYSNEDIQRTGATSLAGALSTMSPSLQVSPPR